MRSGRIGLLLVGLPLAVAVPLVWRTETRAYGVVALAVLVTLLPAALMSFRFAASKSEVEIPSRSFRGRIYAIGALIGAFVAVGGLGLLADAERKGGFAFVYGELVTAELPQGFVSVESEILYHGATWQANGVRYTGTVHADHSELDTRTPTDGQSSGEFPFPEPTIEAYVYPGLRDAYTANHHTSDIDGMEAFAFLPGWLIPGAIGAIAAVGIPSAAWMATKRRRAVASAS